MPTLVRNCGGKAYVTVSGFQALAERASFKPGKVWTDENAWFAVLRLEAQGAD